MERRQRSMKKVHSGSSNVARGRKKAVLDVGKREKLQKHSQTMNPVKEDEPSGEADRKEEEMKNGDVSCDDVPPAAHSADNTNTQETERTSIILTPAKRICTNIAKVVLRRLSQDHLHQIKGSVSQEEKGEEEPKSSDAPLSEADAGDLSVNNDIEFPVADVSCEPLEESSQQGGEEKDPSAADEVLAKAASTDSSLVGEDAQELIESHDGAQNLEETPPTTSPRDSSPSELMEPHTSEKEDAISDVGKNEALDVSCEPLEESSLQAQEEKDPLAADEVEEDGQELMESHDGVQMEPHTSEKEDTISDVEKNEALDPSTESSVELKNSSPPENPIIISSEIKTLELDTCIDQPSVGDCSTNMEEDSLTNVTESFNLDGMGLDQLKKEKIKMKLKVLRLQEEYYKLKMRKLKE